MATPSTSGSVASGTGITAITLALSSVIQMVVFWVFDHAAINNDQAAACALLAYPFVHYAYAKIGYNPGNGNGQPQPTPVKDTP